MMGEFFAAVLATILQMPFEMLIATPWLVAAWLVWLATRRFLSIPKQLVLATFFAAVGLAPGYGTHFSMVPMYTLLWGGLRSPTDAAISFAVTWGVMLVCIFGFIRFYHWKRAKIAGAQKV